MGPKSRLLPSSSVRDGTDKNKSIVERGKKWIKKKLPKRNTVDASSQNHFTYEHMLLRYGDWRNVRGQILAYALLILASLFHKAHGDLLVVIARLDTISVGCHMQCCCEKNERLIYAVKLGQMFGIDNPWSQSILIFAGLFSFTCPLWERQAIWHLGRTNALTIAVLLGILVSICSCFDASKELQLLWSLGFGMVEMAIATITLSTLSEILPYNLRFLATLLYIFISAICNAIAVLHFRFKLIENSWYLGITCAVMYGIGLFIVVFCARDSIIHLTIRNESDIVEEMILSKEMQLYETDPQGSEGYHRAIAYSIFRDLVYMDRDELKLRKFFKKLYSNWAMAEIVLASFQAIAAGAIEYEFNQFWYEQFADPFIINGIMVVGYVIAAIIVFLLRKTHRIKAIQWLLAACLLATCLRHVVVRLDNRNRCSSGNHRFFKDEFHFFAALVCTMTVALGTSLQLTISLHFLETTPSILRPMCVMFVYVPMKLACEVCKMVYGVEGMDRWVYFYHLIIIVITMARSRMKSRLQFSLHLFDIMPQDSDSNSDEVEEKIPQEEIPQTSGMTESSGVQSIPSSL